MIRLLAVLLSIVFVPAVQAQTAERGPIPPGGSRPADGALKGGSIEEDIGTSATPRQDVERCKQLAGELRRQCLRDLGAGAGSTSPSKPLPSPVERDPTAEPPPQNPQAR